MAKPIVATNIDGITEQITDGINGILVPPKDPSVLAKAVIRALNDKKLARTMGLLAREKVEQEFSVDRLAPRKPRPLRRGQGELYKMFIFLTGKPRLLRCGASNDGCRNRKGLFVSSESRLNEKVSILRSLWKFLF